MQTLHITSLKKGQYEAMIKIHMHSTTTWLKAVTVRFILILGVFITFKHCLISDTMWTYSNDAMCIAQFSLRQDVMTIELTRRGVMLPSAINFLFFYEFFFMSVTYIGNCQNVIKQ